MNLSDLDALEHEYEERGYRVRYRAMDYRDDLDYAYLPPLGEQGGALEKAEEWARRLEKVAMLKGFTAIRVVGPDLEPITPAPPLAPVEPWPLLDIQQPVPQLVGAGVVVQSETDWQREHRLRVASLPNSVRRFIAGSDKLDLDVLVNPEALVEGMRDTDD